MRTSCGARDAAPEVYIEYEGCVDVDLLPLLTMEVREKNASEREAGETPQVVYLAERIIQVGLHP
jgi:hypothetical protein